MSNTASTGAASGSTGSAGSRGAMTRGAGPPERLRLRRMTS